MKTLLMVNGQYGDLDWYKRKVAEFDYILCTDGAASAARRMSVIPNSIVGDMDSINEADLGFMEKMGVKVDSYPPEKDYTDMHLALDVLMDEGHRNISIFGGTGGRLDHTMGNILTGVYFAKRGMDISYYEPGLTIYLIKSEIEIAGKPGDTVSVFSLDGMASGVNLDGFKYPLTKARLKQEHAIGVSNELSQNRGRITVASGILAVFHYDNYNRGLIICSG